MSVETIHTFPGVYDEKKLRNNFVTGIVTPLSPTAPQVATPVIAPVSGSYVGTIGNVTITCSTPGATIYYTIDGTSPTISSPVYTGAFGLAQSANVQAFAVLDGYINSQIALAVYIIQSPAIQVSPYILDFGTISFVNTATAAFTITNVGNAPLIGAGNIFGNDAFFITSGTNYNLAPGASQPFNVEFAPHTGSSTYVAFGTFSGGSGTGTTGLLVGHTSPPAPVLQVTPGSIDFGTLLPNWPHYPQGTNVTSLVVTNIGDAALTGTATILGTGTQVFWLSGSHYNNLGPGASQNAIVEYSPTTAGEFVNGSIAFTGGGGASVPFTGASSIPGPDWTQANIQQNYAVTGGDFGGTFPPSAVTTWTGSNSFNVSGTLLWSGANPAFNSAVAAWDVTSANPLVIPKSNTRLDLRVHASPAMGIAWLVCPNGLSFGRVISSPGQQGAVVIDSSDTQALPGDVRSVVFSTPASTAPGGDVMFFFAQPTAGPGVSSGSLIANFQFTNVP